MDPFLADSLRSILVVGDFGSGKTEVAVNLTLQAAAAGRSPLSIADLDLVNPYFRCREALEPLEQAGVRVVVPEGGHRFADLPILLPAVKGLLQDPGMWSVLDVGGDSTGARVLAGLAPAFDPRRHGFWFVVNARRPFNDTVDGAEDTIRRVEGAAGLRVTGIISNTHLIAETTPEMVLEGVALAEAVARAIGVPVALVAAMADVVERLPAGAIGRHPLLVMRRMMVPPWIRRDDTKVGPQAFRPGPS